MSDFLSFLFANLFSCIFINLVIFSAKILRLCYLTGYYYPFFIISKRGKLGLGGYLIVLSPLLRCVGFVEK